MRVIACLALNRPYFPLLGSNHPASSGPATGGSHAWFENCHGCAVRSRLDWYACRGAIAARGQRAKRVAACRFQIGPICRQSRLRVHPRGLWRHHGLGAPGGQQPQTDLWPAGQRADCGGGTGPGGCSTGPGHCGCRPGPGGCCTRPGHSRPGGPGRCGGPAARSLSGSAGQLCARPGGQRRPRDSSRRGPCPRGPGPIRSDEGSDCRQPGAMSRPDFGCR